MWILRIATPVCAPVRNDKVGGAAYAGRGEIGEAPPVAEEASRFRGSAPIGGHDSGRESAGTTVGNRRPLRKHNDLTRREGNTDCHVAPLLAMTVFLRGAVHTGRWGHRSLRMSWRARLVMGGYFAHENPALVCQRWQRTVGVCRIRCSQLRPRRISLFTPLLADSCGFLHRFQELFYHREFQAHPHQ